MKVIVMNDITTKYDVGFAFVGKNLPSEFWRETDDGRTMVPDLSRDVAMKPTPN
jgi:hypothetical protein